MQASSSSSGSGDGEGREKSYKTRKPKVSVQDLATGGFRKAWLKIKEFNDKELHRLQTKLTSMRRALLSQGRQSGTMAIKQLLESYDTPDSKACNRCLINEILMDILEEELNSTQQRSLVQLTELRAQNIKLKEQNRKLSERLRAYMPRCPLKFSDTDDDDSIPCNPETVQVPSTSTNTQVHTPTNTPKTLWEQALPKAPRKSQTNKRKHIDPLEQVRKPEIPVAVHGKDPFTSAASSVETSPTDSPATKKAKVYKSCYPKTKNIPTQKNANKDNRDSATISSLGSKQIAVIESSEEDIPSSPTTAVPSFQRKRETHTSNVFPIDYTSKYIRKRLTYSSSTPRSNTLGKRSDVPLPSNEQSTSKDIAESSNAVCAEMKPKCYSERVPLGSRVRRRIF